MTYRFRPVSNTDVGVMQLVTNVSNTVKSSTVIAGVSNANVYSNNSVLVIDIGSELDGAQFDGGNF